MSLYAFIAILFFAALVLYWLFRRSGLYKGFPSAFTTKAPRYARLAEAAMLSALAIGLWIFAIRRGTGEDYPHDLWVFATFAPLLLAGGLAYRGAVVSAVALLTVILGIYGFVAESGKLHDVVEPEITLAFAPHAPDTEILVNGVSLGTTPLTISMAELRARVPRAEAPKNYLDSERFWTRTSSSSRSGVFYHRWLHIPDNGIEHLMASNPDKDAGLPGLGYYVNAKWEGHEVFLKSTGYSRYGVNVTLRPNIKIPALDNEIVELLQRAWLVDLAVDDGWFADALRYGDYAWQKAKNELAQSEKTETFLETWALRLLGHRRPVNNNEALKTLGALTTQLEETRIFRHDGPYEYAARALIPQVQTEDFIRWARPRVRDGMYWIPPADLPTVQSAGGGPFGTLLIGQMAWWLDQRHEAMPSPQEPNPIENELVPEIIRYGYLTEGSLACAAALGGPHIFDYALRQRNSGRNFSSRPLFTSFTEAEDRWLYLLSIAQGAEAADYRNGSGMSHFLKSARDALDDGITLRDKKEDLSFLFLDTPASKDGLAWTFWPTFRDWAIDNKRNHEPSPHYLFWYLSGMDPLDDGQRYPAKTFDPQAENTDVPFLMAYPLAFRAAFRTKDIDDIFFPQIDELMLPRYRKLEILEAIEREINNLREGASTYQRSRLLEFLGSTYGHRRSLGDEEIIKQFLDGQKSLFESPQLEEKLEEISLWLRDSAPSAPHVALLAHDEDPRFRLAALPAIERRPDAPNWALLQELCEDPDPMVRETAQEVRTKLRQRSETAHSQ